MGILQRHRDRDPARRIAARPRGPLALALEPRLMFDAAAVATAAEAPQQAPADAPSGRTEVAVVDTGVADHQGLVEAAEAAGLEVILISGEGDGLESLAEALEGRQDIDALHILSHGGAGEVRLGDAVLSADTLADHSELLTVISGSLSADGDILLYGCDVGAGTEGEAFLDDLAVLTGADVAASDDATGHADLGGDWDLEVTAGVVTVTPWATAPVPEGSLATTWQHTLGPYVPGTAAEGRLVGSDTGYVASGPDYGGTAMFLVKEVSGSFELFSTNSKGTGSALYIEDIDNKQTSGALIIKANGTTLESFDVSDIEILGIYDDSTSKITVTGYLAGGGTVSTGQTSLISLTDGGFQDLSAHSADFSGFNDITKIKFSIDEVTNSDNSFGIGAIAIQKLTLTDLKAPDTTAPTVDSVSSSTNGAYKVGDTINVTVQFDEAVTVNTTGGTPTLTLETGTTDRTATYTGSSGNTLTFSYTVQAGDVTADLDYTGTTALALNGGTIRDAAGNDATLTLASPGAAGSLGANNAIVVDTTAPTVASVSSSTADGTYKIGDTISVTVQFDEAVTVTGTPQLTLETGSTDRAVDYASGSGTNTLTFTYTIQSGDESADLDYTATSALALNGGTIRDTAGNDATLTLATPGAANSLGANKAIVVDGVAPGSASGSLSVAENAANTTAVGSVSASGASSYSLTDTAGGRFAISGGGAVTVADGSLLDFESNTTHNITVRATDSAGNTTDTVLTVTVTDVNETPVNTVPGTQTGTEDTNLVFSAGNGNALSIADPDTGETLTTTLSVASGTGTLSVTGGSGATVTGDGTNSVSIQGTVAQINAALAAVTYTPTANASGTGYATLTVVSDDTALSDTDNVTINLTGTADTPSVTDSSTTPSTQTTSGLVISRNADDGAEVTHFKITGITNGTLYKNDGTTQINDGDFITFAEGNAGLRFTPSGGGDGSFAAQASTAGNDTGLGGSTTTATISVGIAVANVTTAEDTDSGAIAIQRGDVSQTHYKITSISGGTLYSDAGFTTQISSGDFIAVAGATTNVYFRPTADSTTAGGFQVQAATAANDGALTGNTATSTVTITPVADTPSVTDAQTNPSTQSASGLVISRNANDGAEVTHFKITGITSGTLYKNDGTTQINDGDFITFAEGSAGLRFTPSGATDGSFTVQASTAGNDGGLGGSTATATIDINEAPAVAAAIPDQTANVGSAFSYQVPGSAFSDANGDSLTYGATLSDGSALPAWLTFTSATRAFGGTPTTEGTISVKVTATDGLGLSTSDTFDITIEAAPATPETPTTTQPPTPIPPADPPPADPPPADPPPQTVVTVIRDDAPGAGEAPDTTTTSVGYPVPVLSSAVASGGDALVVLRPVFDATPVAADGRFTIILPNDIFAHTDAGALVQLSATQADGDALPGWLLFNPRTGTFVGQAPPGTSGDLTVRVVARDQSGREAVAVIRITVSGGVAQPDTPGAEPPDAPPPASPPGDATGQRPDRSGAEGRSAGSAPPAKPGFSAELRLAHAAGPARHQAALLAAAREVSRWS